MAEPLSPEVRALFEGKNFVHLAVNRRDGTILSAVLWVHTDGDHLIVNSAEGRAWPAALRREGRATLSIHNAANPYEFASVTASLADDTHKDADQVIDALAKKYMDADSYPFRQPGEQRITFRLTPERVSYRG